MYTLIKWSFCEKWKENRLSSKNIQWRFLLILLSVASVKRKFLKTTLIEESSVHLIIFIMKPEKNIMKISTIYECIDKKSMIFTIRVEYSNFLNLYGGYDHRYLSFLTLFFLQTQQIEVWLVAIDYFRRKPIPRFIFREHSL